MKTQRLYTSKDYNSSIDKAAQLLKNGGIVGVPTETVYGLAASAYNPEAIEKVFTAKGRPQDNPLIVHISDLKMLEEIAKNIPKEALLCASHFWPGPFTMVLEKTEKVPNTVSAGLDTVAVRMPDNKITCDIIRKIGLPLAAPSANTSGKPSPTSALHVEKDLDGKIDAIVYGEECSVGVESTVVSFCCNPPRLLRPGAVTVEQLMEIIPNIIVDNAILEEIKPEQKVESPGMKYKHYAPNTECFLVEAESSKDFGEFVNSRNCAVVCFEEDIEYLQVPYVCYGSKEKNQELAQNVFSVLRKIDELKVEKAYIHAPSKKGLGLAVYNRLIRATAFRVVKL